MAEAARTAANKVENSAKVAAINPATNSAKPANSAADKSKAAEAPSAEAAGKKKKVRGKNICM